MTSIEQNPLDECLNRAAQWAYVPEPLTPQQRYRLVMIAHETKEPSVRTAALTLLAQELHPLVPVP